MDANNQSTALYSEDVDTILVRCEEVMRATPEGAGRFIEPAPGVLARAKSQQHSMIFGRRGSGKSSLLRKTAADLTIDRRPIAFVDMETFKGHTYPDVLISVLIKSLKEFESWLNNAAITPATKTSFWKKLFGSKPNRPPFNKTRTKNLSDELANLIKDLDNQLRKPETSEEQSRAKTTTSSAKKASASASAKSTALSIQGQLELNLAENVEQEKTSKYVSHKVEFLHQNIINFQTFFRNLSNLSDGPSFLILDDLYHIKNLIKQKS
ncbi:ATP-binding protein [Delftia sp. WSY_4]|uniref:ATP-binding protein n=1 Tax=unclassified Delftia TaxID=2613839 RepID=UPI00370A5D48